MTDYLQGSLPSFCQESPVLSHLEVWKCYVLAFLFLYWPLLGIKVTLLNLFIKQASISYNPELDLPLTELVCVYVAHFVTCST
jgi:hypothetical protein